MYMHMYNVIGIFTSQVCIVNSWSIDLFIIMLNGISFRHWTGILVFSKVSGIRSSLISSLHVSFLRVEEAEGVAEVGEDHQEVEEDHQEVGEEDQGLFVSVVYQQPSKSGKKMIYSIRILHFYIINKNRLITVHIITKS